MDEGKLSEETYTNTVLIISITCTVITVFSSLIFIPVTFSLDNEEKEIVDYWMIIQDDTKLKVIKNVSDFL